MRPFSGVSHSGTAWTEHQARESARALLATVAITDVDLTLLRFGNNAVFRVDQRYVIRVARPETPLDDIEQEVQVATALAEHGVPVIRLTTLATPQPLTSDGAYGTLWDYLPDSGDATHAQLGALLRTFHKQTDSLQVQLPTWQPLASARRRLDVLAAQYPPEDIALLEHWYERIQDMLATVQPMLPVGVIHGQAEIGNVLLHNGQPVFSDFERVARGLREWDLIDTAVTTLRFDLPQARYLAFADAYGVDVMAWDGFPTLRHVWELRPGLCKQASIGLR
jgi:Ser/Thr protein kinase RdoA (MazF antagonist)